MRFFVVTADYEVEGYNEHNPQIHKGIENFYVLARSKNLAIKKVRKKWDNINYTYSNYRAFERELLQ